MNKIFFIIALFFSSSSIALSLDKINEELLKYAKEANMAFEDVQQLHDYLIKPTNTDRERAEIFFYWISQHFSYDLDKLNQIEKGEELVKYNSLIERRGVCEDYTDLFQALCDISKIECYSISGYAKGGSYVKGSPFKVIHTWNIIKLDDDYEFVDCTWGSGKMIVHPNGVLKYERKINKEEVFVNSNKFRTRHLPESPKWQLLEYPVSYRAYTMLSDFDKMYHEKGNAYMYKDSIKAFNNIPKEYQPIQERLSAYHFNPSHVNAYECGRSYVLVGQSIEKIEFNAEDIKRAQSYFESSVEWFIKSYKQLNKGGKLTRTQIDSLKKIDRRIKQCKLRLQAKK